MIKVLIVEDHESMCDALKKIFDDTNEFTVVGDVPNANLALLYCQKLNPDLVLVDVCTEGNASGIEATKDIKKSCPDIKVIIMTAFDEISYLPRAKSAGADGFIYKSKSLNYFLKTSKEVISGKNVFPEEKKIPVSMGEVPLTDREMEVLRLVCKHMSNKEIADELFISESTVKYHKANMLAKTGFSKSIDLAFYMITNGWINPLY